MSLNQGMTADVYKRQDVLYGFKTVYPELAVRALG